MKFEKLEAIRGFAALYVFATHLVGATVLQNVIPYPIKLLFNWGQEAVILFFLLSGFVIYISESRRSTIDFPKYFLKRFVRIYPILIASFIISIIVALIERHHFVQEDLKQLIGNIFMLQDVATSPGNIVTPFLYNIPLWTLSYECGFYLMFYPIYVFFLKNKKISISPIYIVLLISMMSWVLCLVFASHLLLVLAHFSLWWAGAACAKIYIENKTFTFKLLKPVLISLAVMVVLTFLTVISIILKGGQIKLSEFPVTGFRHYAVALATIVIGLLWWKINLKGFDTLFGFFERFAPISYALYIIHYSLITLEIPHVNIYLSLTIGVMLTFIISYLLEIKMQPLVNNLVLKRQSK